MNQVQAAPFVAFCRDQAEIKRNNAGFGGERGDGGASQLERMIECFECGLAGIIPEPLRSLHAEFLKTNDPEWLELQRLARKFNVKVD